MRTRNPTQFIIDKFKENGNSIIYPMYCVRFVRSLLSQLPEDWSSLDREELIKRVREHCEFGVTSGKLKRKRDKGISGYIYEILGS